jgi:methyl-accepting chemotaxis protein
VGSYLIMKAPFRRRLGDENDKLAFGLAFFGGIFAIISIRLFSDMVSGNKGISLLDVFAIVVAVAVIAGYVAFILASKNRSGVSVDRASDNVYYLGLLFTLSSLAYSLIKLSFFGMSGEGVASAKQVLTLLPDFGLALFSTIAGIFGRIFLQQMRNDPMDVETEAREELGIAIRQLRETIGQVVSNLNGLSSQMSVTMTEMNNNVAQTLERSAVQNTGVINDVATEVGQLSQRLRDQVQEVTNFTTSSTAQFNDLISNMRTQFSGFGEVPDVLGQKFAELTSNVSAATEQIQRSAELQSELSSELVTAVSGLRDVFSEQGLSGMREVVDRAGSRFDEIDKQLQTNQEYMSGAFSNITSQVDELSAASKNIGEFSGKIEASAKSVDEANVEYVEELSRAAEKLRSKTDQN